MDPTTLESLDDIKQYTSTNTATTNNNNNNNNNAIAADINSTNINHNNINNSNNNSSSSNSNGTPNANAELEEGELQDDDASEEDEGEYRDDDGDPGSDNLASVKRTNLNPSSGPALAGDITVPAAPFSGIRDVPPGPRDPYHHSRDPASLSYRQNSREPPASYAHYRDQHHVPYRSEAPPPPAPKNVQCRFYHKGQCTWGDQCRFLHLPASPSHTPSGGREPVSVNSGNGAESPPSSSSVPPPPANSSRDYPPVGSPSSFADYERRRRLAYESAPWNEPQVRREPPRDYGPPARSAVPPHSYRDSHGPAPPPPHHRDYADRDPYHTSRDLAYHHRYRENHAPYRSNELPMAYRGGPPDGVRPNEHHHPSYHHYHHRDSGPPPPSAYHHRGPVGEPPINYREQPSHHQHHQAPPPPPPHHHHAHHDTRGDPYRHHRASAGELSPPPGMVPTPHHYRSSSSSYRGTPPHIREGSARGYNRGELPPHHHHHHGSRGRDLPPRGGRPGMPSSPMHGTDVTGGGHPASRTPSHRSSFTYSRSASIENHRPLPEEARRGLKRRYDHDSDESSWSKDSTPSDELLMRGAPIANADSIGIVPRSYGGGRPGGSQRDLSATPSDTSGRGDCESRASSQQSPDDPERARLLQQLAAVEARKNANRMASLDTASNSDADQSPDQ